MDSDTSRTTGAMILLLSLLLHIILLLLIFLFQTTSHDVPHFEYIDLENQQPLDPLLQQPLTPQQQQPLNQQQRIELDDQEFEVLIDLIAQGMNPNETLTQEAGEVLRDVATPIPGAIPQESTPTADQEERNDGAADAQDEIPAEDGTEDPSETPTEGQETPTQEPSKNIHEYKPVADTLFAQEPRPTPAPPKPAAPKQAAKKIVRKMAQRKPLTPAQAQALSKFAQGFMQSMNAELGGKPSDDLAKLATQRYTTKIWNYLKQTFNAEKNLMVLSKNVDTYIVLKITLNKQGKLIDTACDGPQRTQDVVKFEDALLTAVRRTGLFPPMPDSFKKEEMTVVIPIRIKLAQGIGNVSLYVQQDNQ